MQEDPIIAQVREVRKKLAEKFGFDVPKMMEDARRRDEATAVKGQVQRKKGENE